MNEIVELWKRMEASDKEEQLFDAFVEARNQYFRGIRTNVRGQELEELYQAERETFSRYVEHRTGTKQ